MTIQNASRDLMFPKALDDIQNAIETTAKTVEDLSLRLAKVSKVHIPIQDSNAKPTPQQPPEAEYVKKLFSNAEQIRHIRAMLEDILANLEL